MCHDDTESGLGSVDRMRFKDWIPVLIPVLCVLATIVPSSVAWYLNENSKREAEEFRRKEDRYIALVESFPGFLTGVEDKTKQDEFMRQLRFCWLYCPDEVIKKGQDFLIKCLSEHKDKYTPEQRTMVLRELMVVIRQDLIGRRSVKETNLGPGDYVIFSRPNKASEAIAPQGGAQPQR